MTHSWPIDEERTRRSLEFSAQLRREREEREGRRRSETTQSSARAAAYAAGADEALSVYTAATAAGYPAAFVCRVMRECANNRKAVLQRLGLTAPDGSKPASATAENNYGWGDIFARYGASSTGND